MHAVYKLVYIIYDLFVAMFVAKHLNGFVEFRGHSQPLFTNRLVYSKMNFKTNLPTSQGLKEVRNLTVKRLLKSTVS